jgi:hypothetical protein
VLAANHHNNFANQLKKFAVLLLNIADTHLATITNTALFATKNAVQDNAVVMLTSHTKKLAASMYHSTTHKHATVFALNTIQLTIL